MRSLLEPGTEAASLDRAGLLASLAEAIGAAADGSAAGVAARGPPLGRRGPARLPRRRRRPSRGRGAWSWARRGRTSSTTLGGDDGTAGGWDVLHLPTLSPVACTAVLEALVGDAIPPVLAARIVARSDGNCLFVEELLRTWAAVGLLARDGEAWRLTVDAAEVPLPQTVQAIYAAQLDDLPTVPRAVVRRGRGGGPPVPDGRA